MKSVPMAAISSGKPPAGRICGVTLMTWTSGKSEIAREALDRIGELYDIEREIAGQHADTRRAARQKMSKPKVEAFRHWAEAQLTRIPGKSDLAKAFRYGLSRWPSFCLFLKDGRVAIDTDVVEQPFSQPVFGFGGFSRQAWTIRA
jgi:transposase IS66 family protein